MPYPLHTKVILQGVLGNTPLSGTEIFSTGFALNSDNDVYLPSSSQCDTITSYLAGLWSNSDMNLCDNAFLTSVTFVSIETTGHWTQDGDGNYVKIVKHPAGGSAAGYSSSRREFPTSVVSSLWTTRAGKHGRGRMYWPLPAEAPDINGYGSDTAAGNRAGTIATAFHNINTVLATGTMLGHVAVVSRAGFISNVTNVRVGNVHDVQRRRRDGLTEKYQVAAVAP